jgi:hypothetical protein
MARAGVRHIPCKLIAGTILCASTPTSRTYALPSRKETNQISRVYVSSKNLRSTERLARSNTPTTSTCLADLLLLCTTAAALSPQI